MTTLSDLAARVNGLVAEHLGAPDPDHNMLAGDIHHEAACWQFMTEDLEVSGRIGEITTVTVRTADNGRMVGRVSHGPSTYAPQVRTFPLNDIMTVTEAQTFARAVAFLAAVAAEVAVFQGEYV